MRELPLFNEAQKALFLKEYNKNTRETYRRILSKCYNKENQLQKDLSEFNYDELDDLFMSFNTFTLNSIISHVSVVNRYINFVGTKTSINFAQVFGGKSLDKYVNKTAKDKRIITREELLDIAYNCENAQDGVIFMLLYEGVVLEECINLKVTKEDVNRIDNKLTLTKNDGTIRTIGVTEDTMDFVIRAIEEDEYIKNNGLVDGNMKVKAFPLPQSMYVLRVSGNSGKKHVTKIDKSVVYHRIKKIAKQMGNPFINVTNIWVSGQVEYAKALKQEKQADLCKADYIKINERFGYDERYWFTTKMRIKDFV